jgi:hypothetical protein
MQSFDQQIKNWNNSITFSKKLIKLKHGEKAPDHYSWVPPPDGYREETDEEFAARVKEKLK